MCLHTSDSSNSPTDSPIFDDSGVKLLRLQFQIVLLFVGDSYTIQWFCNTQMQTHKMCHKVQLCLRENGPCTQNSRQIWLYDGLYCMSITVPPILMRDMPSLLLIKSDRLLYQGDDYLKLRPNKRKYCIYLNVVHLQKVEIGKCENCLWCKVFNV